MTYLGQRVRRMEDPRLLRGAGQYVDDLHVPGMLYAGFVRSPYPSARITTVDGSAALLAPGVAAVHTVANLPEVARPVPAASMPPALVCTRLLSSGARYGSVCRRASGRGAGR